MNKKENESTFYRNITIFMAILVIIAIITIKSGSDVGIGMFWLLGSLIPLYVIITIAYLGYHIANILKDTDEKTFRMKHKKDTKYRISKKK